MTLIKTLKSTAPLSFGYLETIKPDLTSLAPDGGKYVQWNDISDLEKILNVLRGASESFKELEPKVPGARELEGNLSCGIFKSFYVNTRSNIGKTGIISVWLIK